MLEWSDYPVLVSEEPARVDPASACPHCLEARQDWLVWVDDGARVRCTACGGTYAPGSPVIGARASCDVCRKAIRYGATIGGRFVCEDCTAAARRLQAAGR